MQSNRKYICGSKKRSFTSYPVTKHSQLSYTNIRKKLVVFSSGHQPGRYVSASKKMLFI